MLFIRESFVVGENSYEHVYSPNGRRQTGQLQTTKRDFKKIKVKIQVNQLDYHNMHKTRS